MIMLWMFIGAAGLFIGDHFILCFVGRKPKLREVCYDQEEQT